MLVAHEFFGGGEVNAGVCAEFGGGLFLAVVKLINFGPFGPRIVGRALERRAGQDFQLDQALAAVAQGGADAIGAGVAAADDDDILARGGDGGLAGGR